MTKILLFANTDWYLYNFRILLAEALKENGDEVILLSPPGEYVARLQEKGFQWVSFDLSRRGINPFTEISSIIRLVHVYQDIRPDLVHHHTIKCVLYGSLAAKLTKIPAIVNSITGRGFIFSSKKPLAFLLRPIVKIIYKVAFQSSRLRVIFENQTDLSYFISNKIISESKTSLIPGVGVDLKRFSPSPEPNAVPIVLLATRLLWDKGVGVFVEAAKLIRPQIENVRFVLVGDTDKGNPSSIDTDVLQKWQEDQLIEWWGWKSDMPSIYKESTIVSFPTMYGEGIPTVLLEAAACSRAIVATDVPGCREVVKHGVTGLLVPPKDAQALAGALKQLLENKHLRQSMGEKGRQLIVERFSSQQINQQTLAVYQKLLSQSKI